MIRVTCICGLTGQVPDTHAGKQIKCRKCTSVIPVPDPNAVIRPEALPPPPPSSPARSYTKSRRRSSGGIAVVISVVVAVSVLALGGGIAYYAARDPLEPSPTDSPRVAIVKEMLASIREGTAILKTVQDEQTVQKALPRIAKWRERVNDISARTDKMGKASREENDEVDKGGYVEQLKTLTKEFQEEMIRVAKLPGGRAISQAMRGRFTPPDRDEEPIVQTPPKEPTPREPVQPPMPPEPVQPLPPINAELAAEIRTQISDKKLKKWGLVGGAFANEPFEDVPPDGAILVGFRYTINDEYPGTVQPVWQTTQGTVYGKVYGVADKNARVIETRARPGYAVGALYVRGGGWLDAVKPIYMKMTTNGLNINDKYDGPHIGGNGGGEGTLGGDGNFIVGLHGRLMGAERANGTLSPISLTVPVVK